MRIFFATSSQSYNKPNYENNSEYREQDYSNGHARVPFGPHKIAEFKRHIAPGAAT